MNFVLSRPVVYSVIVGAISMLCADRLEANREEQIAGIMLSDIDNTCVKKWDELTSEYYRDFPKILSGWEILGSQCRGTGFYELRLAALYERMGDLDVAISIIDSQTKKESNFDHMLYLNKYMYRFVKLMVDRDKDRKNYEAVIDGIESVIKEYPDWALAYVRLASVQSYIGMTDDAIANAEKAIELDSESWSGYRNLVIFYTKKRRYEEASKIIRKAVGINEGLLSDTEFMLASAATYANVGDVKTAKGVLTVLLEKVPDAKEDTDFRNLVNFLKSKH